MAGDKVSTIAKPKLRGLLAGSIKKNMVVAVALATVVAVTQQVFYNSKRKEVYANFYKNYDIHKEFETMKNKGLFDSC